MTYQSGEVKKKKIELAEMITQKVLNKPFDFKEIHKDDFFKVWEIVGQLNKMTKRYTEEENENANEENEF